MIITNSDLEAYTGVIGDALTTSYLKSAHERVENFLGYKLSNQTYTEDVKSTGRDYIRVNVCPIHLISSITINGVAQNINDFNFAKNFIYSKNGVIPKGAICHVVFSAGYTDATTETESDAPELIKTTILQIAALRQMESNQNIGISSKSFGESGSRIFLSTRKYNDFLANIAKYKLI